MVEPLGHRQTKRAATDMFYLMPPRHISTLPVIRDFVGTSCSVKVCVRRLPVCVAPSSSGRHPQTFTIPDSSRPEIGARRHDLALQLLKDGNKCVSPASSCISKTLSSAAVLAYVPARVMRSIRSGTPSSETAAS